MDYFLLGLVSIFLGFNLGFKHADAAGKLQGEKNTLSQQKYTIEENISNGETFQSTYNISGLYFSDISPDANNDLVIIKTTDLAHFVAIKHFAHIEDYNEVEEHQNLILSNYLKNNRIKEPDVYFV